MTSCLLVPRTVQTNTFVDYGGLPLRAAINWWRSSLPTPAVDCIVSRPPSTLIRSYSYLIACSFPILPRLISSTVLQRASWGRFWVAAIAASWWTTLCLHYPCVPARGVFDEAPVVQPDSDSITPGWGVCGAITYCCWKCEEYDKQSGKSWAIYRKLQVRMEWMTVNLHSLLRLYPAAFSCELQVIPSVPRFALSWSDAVCVLVSRDTLEWTTAEISRLTDIKWKFLDGKDICWYFSQHLAWILPETQSNYHVMKEC